jgi:hypothetical protein
MPHEKPDDLDWLAFCYIADELSPDEVERFESRLADDQEAREAVARAVDLTRAVAAVCAEAPHRTTPASSVAGVWRRMGLAGRLGWAAIAASACLAAVLGYQYYHACQHDRGAAPTASAPQEAPGGERIGMPGSRPDQLAVLWSRTREELADLQVDDRVADFPDEGDVANELSPSLGEDQPGEDTFATNIPPSWVLAAVQAVAGDAGAEGYRSSSPEEN